MAANNVVIGLDLPAGSQPPSERCHDCAVGKMKRSTLSPSVTSSQRIGSLVHSYVCGPMQVNSLGGARYYVSFHDDFSGFRAISFITHKSEVPDCCRAFFAQLHTQSNQLVTVFRSDGGTEYKSLDPWLKTHGIRHETSVRYTPQQNGVSEKDNLTIVDGARTLLYSNTALPLTLWAEAVNCCVYAFNRSISSAHPSGTPFEAWYGYKPDVSNLRTFGSEFNVLVPKNLRRKLDAKGRLCLFIGNSDTQKGDRYWDPVTGKINVSRDVTPSSHYYAPRLPRLDVQHGVDVFLPNDLVSPSVPLNPTNVDIDYPTIDNAQQPLDLDSEEELPTHVQLQPDLDIAEELPPPIAPQRHTSF